MHAHYASNIIAWTSYKNAAGEFIRITDNRKMTKKA